MFNVFLSKLEPLFTYFPAVKKLQRIQISSSPSLTQPEGQPVTQIVSLLLGVSRLHFSLYLVHALYVRWFWSVSRGLMPYSFFDIVSFFWMKSWDFSQLFLLSLTVWTNCSSHLDVSSGFVPILYIFWVTVRKSSAKHFFKKCWVKYYSITSDKNLNAYRSRRIRIYCNKLYLFHFFTCIYFWYIRIPFFKINITKNIFTEKGRLFRFIKKAKGYVQNREYLFPWFRRFPSHKHSYFLSYYNSLKSPTRKMCWIIFLAYSRQNPKLWSQQSNPVIFRERLRMIKRYKWWDDSPNKSIRLAKW